MTSGAWDSLLPRQWWNTLSLAENDLRGAEAACKLAIKAVAPIDGELRRALVEIAIVRYYRPFAAASVVDGVKAHLPAKYLKSFTREQRIAHDRFKDLRNQAFAHRDHTTTMFMNFTHMIPDKSGGEPRKGETGRVPMSPDLRPADLDLLLALIGKVRTAIAADHTALAQAHGMVLSIDVAKANAGTSQS